MARKSPPAAPAPEELAKAKAGAEMKEQALAGIRANLDRFLISGEDTRLVRQQLAAAIKEAAAAGRDLAAIVRATEGAELQRLADELEARTAALLNSIRADRADLHAPLPTMPETTS